MPRRPRRDLERSGHRRRARHRDRRSRHARAACASRVTTSTSCRDQDWFDGIASFTFGGGDAACFRDRIEHVHLRSRPRRRARRSRSPRTCAASSRGSGQFWPFARAGVGVGIVRFSDDDVTGLAIPLHAGGGVRAPVSPTRRDRRRRPSSTLGLGVFGQALGVEPQLGARDHRGRRIRAAMRLACARRASRARARSRRAASASRRSRRRRRSSSRVTDGGTPVGGARAAVRRAEPAGAHRHDRSVRQAPGRDRVRDRAGRRRLVGRPHPRDGTARFRSARRVRAVAGDPVRPLQGVGVARHRVRALGGRGRSVGGSRQVELAIALERAWTPHGTLAADLHVHAHASNDSTHAEPAARDRAGRRRASRSIGLSDHNTNGDLDRRDRRRSHLDDRVASIASNELTADALHVGVYPVPSIATRRAAAHLPRTSRRTRSAAAAVRDRARDARTSDRPAQPPAVPRHRALRRHRLGRRERGRRRSRSAFDAVEVLAGYSAFNIAGRSPLRRQRARLLHAHRSRSPRRAARQQRHPRSQLGARRHRAQLRVRRRSAHAAVRRGRLRRRDPRAPRRRDDRAVARRRGRPRKQGATPTVGPGPVDRADRGARVGRRHARRRRSGSTSSGSASPSARRRPDARRRRSTCPPDVRTHHWAGRVDGRHRRTRGSASPPTATRRCRSSSPARTRRTSGTAPASRRSRSPRRSSSTPIGDGRWKRGDAIFAALSVRTRRLHPIRLPIVCPDIIGGRWRASSRAGALTIVLCGFIVLVFLGRLAARPPRARVGEGAHRSARRRARRR